MTTPPCASAPDSKAYIRKNIKENNEINYSNHGRLIKHKQIDTIYHFLSTCSLFDCTHSFHPPIQIHWQVTGLKMKAPGLGNGNMESTKLQLSSKSHCSLIIHVYLYTSE